MDDLKKTTVLNYITAITGEKVSTLLDLRSGRVYVQILGFLDQWNKKGHLETDKDRLTCVQSFLQDYYGHDVKLDEFLNFDAIIEAGVRCSESQLELELAKIAVVLLGIGLLDTNGQHFIGSGLKLPQGMHSDVMAIMQSVVQAGSTEVVLTANIANVLLEPSDNKSPPQSSSEKSMDPYKTTPKKIRFSLAKASHLTDSPQRLHTPVLNYSLWDITPPLRRLSIDTASPSSPSLAQFVQSPQLLQKAALKQRDLEMRKLKQSLSDQMFLNDELHLNLHNKTAECANKDGEIWKLQDEIKDLLHMRDSYDELQDMKARYSDQEILMDRLKQKLQRFERYKEECQQLEKDKRDYQNEVEKLHQDKAALQAEANKYRDSLKTISDLQMQMDSLQLQLAVMHRSKSDWDLERGALQGNLEMAKDTAEKLKQERDELLNKQEDIAPGESMGVILDIQIRELRCQLDERTQEILAKDTECLDSNSKVADLSERILHLENELQTQKHSLDTLSEAKTNLESRLREKVNEITDVTGQYEAKIQTIDAEHETRLQQLCEDLKLQQQAQKQMEEDLIAQKKITESLRSSFEQEKLSHDTAVYSILQEHDRKISVMEQTHASKVAMLMSEKDQLLEEMEDYRTKVSELQAVGLPSALPCADEQERTDFEWDRLSELQRRNTTCLPHMKPANQVEMQMASQDKFTDDSWGLSLLPNKRGGICTGPVYKRPGTPTPGKHARRISGRFTPYQGGSPIPGGSAKGLGSPIARPNHRRSPSRRTPMSRLATTINEENQESVTFNIGFTPKESSAPKKLLHQTGFLAKDKDKSKATTDPLVDFKSYVNVFNVDIVSQCVNAETSCLSVSKQTDLSVRQISQDFPDIGNGLAEPAKLHSENNITPHSGISKNIRVKNTFKLSKRMKKVRPFWKKHTAACDIPHVEPVQQNPAFFDKPVDGGSGQPSPLVESQNKAVFQPLLEVDDVKKSSLKQITLRGKKSGTNVFNLQAKFEHMTPKVVEITECHGSEVPNKNLLTNPTKCEVDQRMWGCRHEIPPDMVDSAVDAESICGSNELSTCRQDGRYATQHIADLCEGIMSSRRTPVHRNHTPSNNDADVEDSPHLRGLNPPSGSWVTIARDNDNAIITPSNRKRNYFTFRHHKVTPM